MLAGEVRHFRIFVGVDDRQIDDALDAGLARHVQRLQRLGELVGHQRVEQEQGAHAGHRRPQGVDVGEVADDGLDAFRQRRLAGLTDQGADLGALRGQAANDEGTDGSGGTDDEDAHLKLRLKKGCVGVTDER